MGDALTDEIHSIKRVPDGSYVVAGQLEVPLRGNDLFIRKFELTACDKPSGLAATIDGCSVILSWTTNPCVPSYVVKYKKYFASTWTTVNTTTSPITITPSSGKFKWTVQAQCSPNIISDTTIGISFEGGCSKIGEAFSDVFLDTLILFPNPCSSSFRISLEFSDLINNETATISIVNSMGKVVSSFQLPIIDGIVDESLNVDKLPSGFYWVKVNALGNAYQTKFIIQKN